MESRKIDAAPTKDFFISMLVRDIELIPAIGDLVDNSVDGARRLRLDASFNNLFVRVTADESHFQIEDNCGGIPVNVAERYAFRFGRPPGMESTPHSIGQFGVGMKRALFKLGSSFRIESSTETESFQVDVDVPTWQTEDEWEFPFTRIGAPSEVGTTIAVNKLHDSTAESFGQSYFVTRLARSIGAHHQQATNRGLVITLNGTPVGGQALELLSSYSLQPASSELVLFEDTEAPVNVKIYVGVVTESEPQLAGWYIYCNGRLVLDADKTDNTGWGAQMENQFPRFHNRYGRFRGYVFFDSDDASKLPWTTTKTGLDADSAVYRRTLQVMLQVGKPVTTFLQDLSREVENPPEEEDLRLERLIASAQPAQLEVLRSGVAFSYIRPRPKPPPPIPTQSIQYRRPVSEIEAAKRVLNVWSAAEVGQRTFEYFFARECRE